MRGTFLFASDKRKMLT